MILYNAVDAKFGSSDVLEIRLGSNTVWSGETDPEGIWTFNNPSSTDTIILKATFAGRVTAHWGDGDTDNLTSGVSITHTYN
jgi:hypothetical protein